MEQQKILFNGIEIQQPDEGLGYDFETTYSEDTGRVQSGVLHLTPLFTVESFSYEATDLTIQSMKQILEIVAKGSPFTMYYFSPYYGIWRTDTFYVGRGSLSIGTLEVESERYESLSFNIIGINPI